MSALTTIVAEPDGRRFSIETVLAMFSCGRWWRPAGGVTLRGLRLVRDSGLPDAWCDRANRFRSISCTDDLLAIYAEHATAITDKLTGQSLVAIRQHQTGLGAGYRRCRRLRARKRHLGYSTPSHEIGERRYEPRQPPSVLDFAPGG